MELCPRCTSTVADAALACPSCGAAIWQPTSTAKQVAVTPAPVALVPPVPEPASSSVMVQLPPQRIASVDAPPRPDRADEPPPPTGATTVVPANPPTGHKQNHLAVGIGTLASLLVVVVLIVALPAHGAHETLVPVAATNGDAQFDLRALAKAEETNLTATRVYTADSTDLEDSGYQPMPGVPVTIRAGIGKDGYCLVASAGGSAPWYLYDSAQGGLIDSGFASEALAHRACAVAAIKSYATIT